jgi:hypothetical protein
MNKTNYPDKVTEKTYKVSMKLSDYTQRHKKVQQNFIE